jgi:hypothetical protein
MARVAQTTPLPKTHAAAEQDKKDSKRVDQDSKDSFPASDPPSYNSGSAIGAPKKRETPPPDMKDFEHAAKKK